jgi:hypothetical protein
VACVCVYRRCSEAKAKRWHHTHTVSPRERAAVTRRAGARLPYESDTFLPLLADCKARHNKQKTMKPPQEFGIGSSLTCGARGRGARGRSTAAVGEGARLSSASTSHCTRISWLDRRACEPEEWRTSVIRREALFFRDSALLPCDWLRRRPR